MENATKALIIAASILVVLLIVSLAIGIVNSSEGTFGSAQNTMSELEIQSFNDKFAQFEGSNKSSSQVIALLKTIESSNFTSENKVAVKISDLDRVYDSTNYYIKDDNGAFIKGPAGGDKVSVTEMIDIIKHNKAYRYTVTYYYCNEPTLATSNNRHLNPAVGCVLLVIIDKN